VAEDRKQSSLDGFWETLPRSKISGIEAVAMDMWDPYVVRYGHICRKRMARSFSTKFHVAQHLGDAVDRYGEGKQNSESPRGRPFGGHRYDWLRNPTSMEPKDRKEFAELRNSELKTARAWALKETAMTLYSYVYERPARKHFRWWHNWAVRSRPATDDRGSAECSNGRFEETSSRTCRHRITNAASESIMPSPMGEVHGAGFRNRQNFVHADLLPLWRPRHGPGIH